MRLTHSPFFSPFLLLGLLLIAINEATWAQPNTLEQFINNMVTQHHFDPQYLTQLFKQVKIKNNILSVMDRPGEAKPWYQYRTALITPSRINQGLQFWKQQAASLTKATAQYGVPAEIVIAIIGIETSYGDNTGNFKVIESLTTLGFHYPRRAEFFQGELEAFLLITREEGLDPLQPEGSYAGAMGIGQFMPTSYRKYAVDFNKDGKRNIWTSFEDAIGSVANYLHQHGWQREQSVITPTKVRPDAIDQLLSLKFEPNYTLQELAQQGLSYNGNEPPNTLAMIIDLKTELGTAYWVGFKNFYVITRYNRSKNYAMAVYQLAQEIAHLYSLNP